jgi:hypothetical protein
VESTWVPEITKSILNDRSSSAGERTDHAGQWIQRVGEDWGFGNTVADCFCGFSVTLGFVASATALVVKGKDRGDTVRQSSS